MFVMSDFPSQQVELVEEAHELHKLNRANFIDEQEWYLYKVRDSRIYIYLIIHMLRSKP